MVVRASGTRGMVRAANSQYCCFELDVYFGTREHDKAESLLDGPVGCWLLAVGCLLLLTWDAVGCGTVEMGCCWLRRSRNEGLAQLSFLPQRWHHSANQHLWPRNKSCPEFLASSYSALPQLKPCMLSSLVSSRQDRAQPVSPTPQVTADMPSVCVIGSGRFVRTAAVWLTSNTRRVQAFLALPPSRNASRRGLRCNASRPAQRSAGSGLNSPTCRHPTPRAACSHPSTTASCSTRAATLRP